MPTTKKPTTKNLHYGGDSGFPPKRGFGGDPRRDPRIRPRRRPLGRPTDGRGRQMTPAMRRRLIELRKRAQQRRQSEATRQQLTPAQRERMRRQLEAGAGKRLQVPTVILDRFNNSRNRFNKRRRRPSGPLTPQLVPQQRRNRPASPPQLVREAIPVPASAYPTQEVRQAIPEPRQRPRGRRVVAKGGAITKKRIGANDFRKGGYVLSTVDNRKNKK